MNQDANWITAAIEEVAQTAVRQGEYWRAGYTDRDAAAVALLKGYMEEAGMETYFDAVGNLFGRIPGKSEEVIMSGSHRDTVRHGGKYDGMLGVLASLKAAASLYAEYGQPEKTVEVAVTCEEESSRFPLSYLGSHNICGMFDEALLDTPDEDGITLRKALKDAGYLHCPVATGNNTLKYFVELHIEQGGVLENLEKQVGVVTSIVGLYSGYITFTGHQNHAGTTPMSMRKDPMPAAASFITKLHRWACQYMDDMVVTVGSITAKPGNANVIADTVTISVDIRSSITERIRQADAEIHRLQKELSGDIEIDVNINSDEPPVMLDAEGVDTLKNLAEKRGLAYHIMSSGAGHDSQVVAQKYPVNMIFVPSVDGISHNTAEYTKPADIEAGYLLLRDYLKELAW